MLKLLLCAVVVACCLPRNASAQATFSAEGARGLAPSTRKPPYDAATMPIVTAAYRSLHKHVKGRTALTEKMKIDKTIVDGQSWIVVGKFKSSKDERTDFTAIVVKEKKKYNVLQLLLGEDVVYRRPEPKGK